MQQARAGFAVVSAPLAAVADVRVGAGSLGIRVPSYPRMVRVPAHPVYLAPQQQGNLFFYDGLYWVLEGDDWHASTWYGGPWDRIRPEQVPAHLLQVPVNCYRSPPPYFSGWAGYAPPR
jgi:hypothetical protein